MLDALPKAAFSVLASSGTLKRLASRYGMRRPGSFARRFIAGETIAEAIDAARQIERQGLHDHARSTRRERVVGRRSGAGDARSTSR